MNQFLQWLLMGGYSIYVWPAYGLVAFFLISSLLGLRWQGRQVRKRLAQWYKRSAGPSS